MKKGFTLVELSIVLVIIGLLIGGLLAANSMINTAKSQALIRQIGQLDAATENFRTAYNQLPGDSSYFGSTIGNNNGTIQGPSFPSYFDTELAHFFYDLGMTGLKNEDGAAYLDGSTSRTYPIDGKYVPNAKFGKSGTVIIPYGNSGVNYFVIGDHSFAGVTLIMSPTFKPAEVLTLDTKVDDGLASSGNLNALDTTDNTGTATVGTTCTVAAAGNTYVVATTTETCFFRIRMGTSTGNLK